MAMKTIFLFSLLCCAVTVICENQCSPFSYHEQMLEKMVDVKYKMEIFMGRFESWEKLIDEKLSSLDGTVEKHQLLENELLNKFKELETGLKNSMLELGNIPGKGSENPQIFAEVDRRLRHLQNQILYILSKQEDDIEAKMLKLSNSLLKLKNDFKDSKTPVVLFKARNVKDLSPSDGSTVIFQTIVQNEGDGYDSGTGIFTAPVNGTYLFTTQFCLNSETEMAIRILVNDNTLIAANYGDVSWGAICDATDGISEIVVGNKVRVQVTTSSRGEVIIADDIKRYWSSFSGVLLNA